MTRLLGIYRFQCHSTIGCGPRFIGPVGGVHRVYPIENPPCLHRPGGWAAEEKCQPGEGRRKDQKEEDQFACHSVPPR